MKIKLTAMIALSFCLLLSQVSIAAASINNTESAGISGVSDTAETRYIISYYNNKKINSELEMDLNKILSAKQKLSSNLEMIEFSSDENIKENIEKIKSDPAVRVIEKDVKRYTMDLPNDEYYSQQWNLDNIDAVEAWQFTGALEKPVKVAVIDSGIDALHSDLYGRIAPGGKGFLNGNVFDTITDSVGHGTGVSGIIAARTGNGLGIAGVSGTLDVSVLPLKVFWNSEGCYTSDIINALDYAISQDVDVINLSLGSTEYSQLEAEAIQRTLNAGIIVVASSGNNGDSSTAGQYCYPASYYGVISVGSISEDSIVSYFSNFNDKVFVVAPGENILTIDLNNSYAQVSGTSFSAPMVSAIAAVLVGENPTKTPEQIKSDLESGVNDLGSPGKDVFYGFGSVNFNNSLDSQQTPDGSTGLIDQLIIDKEGMRILVNLDGTDGYAFAYSAHNNLYKYLSGVGSYPNVFGLKSGSKYMQMGGMDGYAVNFSTNDTPLQAMVATPEITRDVINTFYYFQGFDINGQAILIPLYI